MASGEGSPTPSARSPNQTSSGDILLSDAQQEGLEILFLRYSTQTKRCSKRTNFTHPNYGRHGTKRTCPSQYCR